MEDNYFTVLWWFCHTSAWISHRDTSVPTILNCPPISLPTLSLWVVPEHWLCVPCLMHPTCMGYLFYMCSNAFLSNYPTLAFSHGVQESVLYICLLCCPACRISCTIFLKFICIYICIAAAAKSLQSCQTLCDPVACSLPGSSHGIFQAGVLEWGGSAFSDIYVLIYSICLSFSDFTL